MYQYVLAEDTTVFRGMMMSVPKMMKLVCTNSF
jgi:hypothetical protein